jgi:hypothetical protein
MSSVRNTSAKTVKMSDMVDMNMLLHLIARKRGRASTGDEEKLSLQQVLKKRQQPNTLVQAVLVRRSHRIIMFANWRIATWQSKDLISLPNINDNCCLDGH